MVLCRPEVEVLRTSRLVTVGVIGALALGGCDKDERGQNARKATALPDDETATPLMSTVYQYSGAAQALSDMARYTEAEKWAEAMGVAEALLKEEANHPEAKRILELAKREGQAQLRMNDFSKRVAAHDVPGAVRVYKQIPENSQYRGRAQADYEKLRDNWLAATEADVRTAVRTGRCEDARRGARVTAELFPEGRQAMEGLVTGCKPREAEVAAKDKAKDREDEVKESAREKPVEVAMAPVVAKPERERERERESQTANVSAPAPEPRREVASARPQPTPPPAPAPAASPAPAAPAPAAPKKDAKPVPLAALEKLRTGGAAKPELPRAVTQLMKRDQVKGVMIAAKLCVGESGSVTTVTLMKASQYDEANEKVISEIKKWKFKPYMENGAATPVCSAAMLNYQVNLQN
jgi:hypothetical protein